jgi:serine protease Do
MRLVPSVLAATVLWMPLLSAGVAAQAPLQPSPTSITAVPAREIARRQNPAIVSITTRTHLRPLTESEAAMLRFFGATPPSAGERVKRQTGTGFIISAAGEILTSSHLVAGADAIDVDLLGDSSRRFRAVEVGRDPLSDTALIRLESPPPHLRTVTFGDSSSLEPGDWVMAIGNPFELGHTVTVGVVGFQQRPVQVQDGYWQDLIQVDAAINPGNSGGPLIDASGEVVGINVSSMASRSGRNFGIGFAVPINAVKSLLPQLRSGRVVRGQLGIDLLDGPVLEDEARALGLPRAAGAVVKAVDVLAAVARTDLRAGDVIVEIDSQPVADAHELVARVSSMTPGRCAAVTIFRNGSREQHTVTIEELSDSSELALAPLLADAPDPDGGLTLEELTPSASIRLEVPRGIVGALVADVALGSAADDAELSADDIIRVINRRPVHDAAEAARALGQIRPGEPIFLLVWRDGADVFLRMRKD